MANWEERLDKRYENASVSYPPFFIPIKLQDFKIYLALKQDMKNLMYKFLEDVDKCLEESIPYDDEGDIDDYVILIDDLQDFNRGWNCAIESIRELIDELREKYGVDDL